MKTLDFLTGYWKQYIELEKEFAETIPYLEISTINNEAFSRKYAKLMLQIGSECDITLKKFCKEIDMSFNGRSIDKYRICIKKECHDFPLTSVSIELDHNRLLRPWDEWAKGDSNPSWWTVYNKNKHQRTDLGKIDNIQKMYSEFANQKYTINALAGLYVVEIFLYRELIKSDPQDGLGETPLPGSRLFHLTGGAWDNVTFYRDTFIEIDNSGHLRISYGEFSY